jgi:acyl dehydratase
VTARTRTDWHLRASSSSYTQKTTVSPEGKNMYGRFFEDFKVGEKIKHWPGRTISEADDTWFSLLCQNDNPLHIDANYAENHTQHGQRLTNGTLVFAIAVGQTVRDLSGRAIANLEYEKITHHAPVFHGDTIYTVSEVLELRVTSKGDRGTMLTETVVTKQDYTKVMTFLKRVLLPMRNHPVMGEGMLPND